MGVSERVIEFCGDMYVQLKIFILMVVIQRYSHVKIS